VSSFPAILKLLSPFNILFLGISLGLIYLYLQPDCIMLFRVGLQMVRRSHSFGVSGALRCFWLACGWPDTLTPLQLKFRHQQTQTMTFQGQFICIKLAEVPGAARVNLQPAEHLLFCEQFSKMCP